MKRRQLLCTNFTISFTYLTRHPNQTTNRAGYPASPSHSQSVSQSCCYFLPSLLLLCDYVSCVRVCIPGCMCVCLGLMCSESSQYVIAIISSIQHTLFAPALLAYMCVTAEINSNYLWPLIYYFLRQCICGTLCGRPFRLIIVHG